MVKTISSVLIVIDLNVLVLHICPAVITITVTQSMTCLQFWHVLPELYMYLKTNYRPPEICPNCYIAKLGGGGGGIVPPYPSPHLVCLYEYSSQCHCQCYCRLNLNFMSWYNVEKSRAYMYNVRPAFRTKIKHVFTKKSLNTTCM